MARLYANENFPLPVVNERRRRLGHDVLTTQRIHDATSVSELAGKLIRVNRHALDRSRLKQARSADGRPRYRWRPRRVN